MNNQTVKPLVRKCFKFQKISELSISTESRPMSSITNKTINSFLVEIDHNYDVDTSIRRDIEKKFKKSSVNACYKFPRISAEGNSALPAIRQEPRNPTHNNLSFGGISKKLKEKLTYEEFLAENYKIPSINRKLNEKNKKTVLNSLTPSPYANSIKNNFLLEMTRSTPSPAPRTKGLTVRTTNKLL